MPKKEKGLPDNLANELVQQGLRTREIRNRRKFTLEDVASLTGLSKGHLSRFERGEKSLSIAAVLRVATALQTSVAEIFGENIDSEAVYISRASQRRFQSFNSKDGKYEYAAVSKPSAKDSITTLFVKMPASTLRSGDGYHSGEEIMYILDGSVEVNLPDKTVLLEKGDYFQFPGHLNHAVKGIAPLSHVMVVIVPS